MTQLKAAVAASHFNGLPAEDKEYLNGRLGFSWRRDDCAASEDNDNGFVCQIKLKTEQM